jgi:hypothetical protein
LLTRLGRASARATAQKKRGKEAKNKNKNTGPVFQEKKQRT